MSDTTTTPVAPPESNPLPGVGSASASADNGGHDDHAAHPPRTRTAEAIDAIGLLAFSALVVLLVWRIVGAGHTPGALGSAIWWTLLGWVAADFASGVVHWMFDRYFDPSTPFIGIRWVAPFREHHVSPKAICDHGFLETNGNNAIGTVPLLAGTVVLMPATGTFESIAPAAFFVSLCAFTVLTNQVHKWAHASSVPGWVGFLQRVGLILSPANHAVHHVPPHRKHFCITAGWLNRILDGVRFYDLMEVTLRLVGIRPSAPDDAPAPAAAPATAASVSSSNLPRAPH